MNKQNKTILASVIAVILSNGLLVTTSDAQSAGSDKQASATEQKADTDKAVALPSVTVTSRRVEEQAQDVPLPVTVFSAATIDNKGLQNVQDISRFTPGFTFHESFGRVLDRPVIRGQVNILGEPNASFFIDGVFVEGNISGYDLSDVERVEVIRGPQSALFGRRTFSGAVNFITKLPGNKPSGSASVQFGNKGQKQARFSYSAPLADTLSFRVNAYRDQRDGLYHNTVSAKDDLGGQATTSFGGSLFWNPNNSFSAVLRANYLHDQDQAAGFYRYGLADANCGGTATGGVYAYFAPIYTGRPYQCGKIKVPDQLAINTDSFHLAGYGAGVNSSSVRANLALNYYFQNGWQLSSTSAYNSVDGYLGVDQDYSGVRGFGGAFETFSSQPSHDFSQEFRLASDQGKPLHGLVGVYYYSQGNGYGYKGDLTGFNLTPGLPGNSLAPVVTTAVTPNATIRNVAVFGLLEYQFNDHWKASAELRRGQDKIGATGVDNELLVISGVPTALSQAYNSQSTFTSTLPRFTVSYKVHDGLNFYALAAKGNKPGGFNASIEDARMTPASRASLIAQGSATFKEETAWTTELGMKSMWLDNRLRLNVDVFNINWTNQQLTTNGLVTWLNGQSSTNSYISNIGKSRIRGLEFESEYLISREWLMNFTYSHLDAKIIDNIDPDYLNYIGTNNAKGKYLPAVPGDTASLGVTYQGVLANGWGLFGNADAEFEGSRYGDPTNVNWTGSATTFNFRLGIEPVKNLRISAYVNNAFDNHTGVAIMRNIDPTVLIAYPNLVTGSGYSVNYARSAMVTAPLPRMFGLRAEYRF
ncbi:TonB-dependent receptor [Rhodanobacter sp. AS-Z3]|uniref:TonB-dependent receptor n=1 Tax=Rhodanobacter sp. AS-Z3 TaxID=3031330 RepID=UPI0024784E53|nr:TonB-dependent receptor [Rhodanobacter sp. AS-Z3]WEN14100.1 TonB-dependent receptor [Rhodanobacter sp. AS-Z3]